MELQLARALDYHETWYKPTTFIKGWKEKGESSNFYLSFWYSFDAFLTYVLPFAYILFGPSRGCLSSSHQKIAIFDF